MSSNHFLLNRLATLMLQHEQQSLSVDLLFDDEKIGDLVKSVQIDSPYQQLLLQGVLTESVKGGNLFVGFTVEGYFHYNLGEVLYSKSQNENGQYLLGRYISSKLPGIERGITFALDHQVRNGSFDGLTHFINSNENHTPNVCLDPVLNAFILLGIERTAENLFTDFKENQIKLLTLVRSKLKYTGKKKILSDLDQLLWKKINKIKAKDIQHFFLLSQQLISRDSFEINDFYSAYQVFKKLSPTKNFHHNNVEILENLGQSFLRFSEKKIALSCYESAMNEAESAELQLHLKSHVAQINKSMSNTNIAVKYYQEVIDTCFIEGLWSIESKTKLRLGEIFKQQGRFSDALILFEDVISVYKKKYGNYHSETARSLGYLGSYYIYIQHWEDAEKIIRESMNIRVQILGEYNTKTCISYVNYAEILNELSDFKSCKFYLEKALLIRINKFGRDHQDVAYTLFGLGNMYLKMGDLSLAKKHHNEALEIRERKLGSEHIFTQKSRLTMLSIHAHLGEFQDFLTIKMAYLSHEAGNQKEIDKIEKMQRDYFK